MKPSYCPKCNTPIKDYETSRDYEGVRGYPFKCKKCGFEGIELRREVFAGFLNDDGIAIEECPHCGRAMIEEE